MKLAPLTFTSLKASPRLCASIALLTGLITGQASAQLITVANADQSSVRFGGYTATQTIDGSGLSGDGTTHDAGTQVGWFSNGPVAEQWIEWDLGDSYELDSIHVWNYIHSPSLKGIGINQVDIYVSNVGVPGDPEGGGSGNWTLWAENANLPMSSGADGDLGFDLETVVGAALPTTDVRWMRFEVDTNHTATSDAGSFNASTGLAEIQFTAVPEPGAFALLSGMFGLTWVMLRRR